MGLIKNNRQSNLQIYKYTLANVNLRQNKSTSANIITVIPKDSKVEMISAEDEWVEVLYNSQKGYVYKDYLSTTKYNWSKVIYNDQVGYVFNYFLSDDGNKPNDLDYR